LNIVNKIDAFAKLGEILRNPDSEMYRSFRTEIGQLRDLIIHSTRYNPWFTPASVKAAIYATGQSLQKNNIEKWLNRYDLKKLECKKEKTVGVIMAGNIPMVGFHDFISVLISGNKLVAKLSSDDNQLLPVLAKMLVKIEPSFSEKIQFTGGKLENFDAIIATGSDNTSRYFEFYFSKYPHIIRKNRNGVAVLTRGETEKDFASLGNDIFTYFGLGCRNVTKLFLPKGFSFDRFYENIKDFVDVINHHKYKNNYDYFKSVYLVNRIPHLDNGFLMMKEDESFSSPPSVVFYEFYENTRQLNPLLDQKKGLIQCIVSIDKNINNAILPGKAQQPELWDYADGIDTIAFLSNLAK